MRAIQVAEVAASLNSDDVFVLETPSKTYQWNGVVSQIIFRKLIEVLVVILIYMYFRNHQLMKRALE